MKKTTWFNLMWSNGYIFAFLVNAFFILLLFFKKEAIIEYSSRLAYIIALVIPIITLIIIVWFGFIRFWQRFKKFVKFYDENVNPD